MSENSGYDLTPAEPRKETPRPPDQPAVTPTGAAPSGAFPASPGFVPPVPIVEGPDPDPDEIARLDAEENRATACLAYIIFLLPLVFAPKSKFARYHANQGLLLACCWAVWFVILMVVWVGSVIVEDTVAPRAAMVGKPLHYLLNCACMPLMILFGLGLVVLALQGIITAANGEMKPLPVIGKPVLIKPFPEPGPKPSAPKAEAPTPPQPPSA